MVVVVVVVVVIVLVTVIAADIPTGKNRTETDKHEHALSSMLEAKCHI